MSQTPATAPSSGPRHLGFSGIDAGDGPERVAAGLAFVRQAVADWLVAAESPGDDEERAVDVVLVAAELLGNAERHGGGAASVDLEQRHAVLRLTVVDRSSLPPRPARPHRPERVGGHGLHIVDCLSTTWGWESHGSGKAVWAELPGRAA